MERASEFSGTEDLTVANRRKIECHLDGDLGLSEGRSGRRVYCLYQPDYAVDAWLDAGVR